MKPQEMRTYLKEYRLLLKEIAARREHLSWLWRDVYLPLLDVPDFNETIMRNTQRTMLDIIADLQKELQYFRQKANEVEKLIRQLDGDERLVIYNRYICGVRWIDMPGVVNYEIAHCQRIERRAIIKLIKLKSKLACFR